MTKPTDLMIRLEPNGKWYHVKADAIVFEGYRWSTSNPDWVEHGLSPKYVKDMQRQYYGSVPTLVPQT